MLETKKKGRRVTAGLFALRFPVVVASGDEVWGEEVACGAGFLRGGATLRRKLPLPRPEFSINYKKQHIS